VTAAAGARCPGAPPLPRRRYRHSRLAGGLPTWARVARVLPAGRVPARDQRGWLHDQVEAELDVEQLRAHARANIRAVATVLANHGAWHGLMVSRPTWAVLIQRTGLCRATIAAHLRWLREHQLLAIWQPGRTAGCRPMALAGTETNQAAEYLLLAGPTPERALAAAERPAASPADDPLAAGPEYRQKPAPATAVEETWTPTWSRRDSERNPRVRETSYPPGRQDRGPGRPAETAAQQQFRRDRGRPIRLELADKLRNRSPVLRQLSVRHLASLLRDHVNAGWSLPDLMQALDYQPTGARHWQTDRVRSPAGWLRHRLDLWRDSQSNVLPSPALTASSQRWRQRVSTAQQARALAEQPHGNPAVGAANAQAALTAACQARHRPAGEPR